MCPTELKRESQDSASAAEGCINGKTKYFRFDGSSLAGRRAMVNKLWFRDVYRKSFHVKSEPPNPQVFSEPKLQARVELWYLAYRWIIFLLWTCIIFCSIFEIGSVKPMGQWEKWPIYLTNWDLLLGFTQSLLAIVLVHKRYKLQKKASFDPMINLNYGTLEKIYWFLYIVTTTVALGVTVTYWSLVHDPQYHHVDPLNVMLHVCNSLLMLADFCMTNVPFKIRFVWWCLSFVTFYLLFSVIYYLAGGVSKNGNRYIYKVLDWQNPGRTLAVCAGGLTFVAIVHCLMYFLAKLKNYLYDKRSKSKLEITKPYETKSRDEVVSSIKQNDLIV